MSDPFIGEIKTVGFTFAPRGWAECNGALFPIAQNSALFSLLGVNFGGNGVSTFALPDLRNRVPIGQFQGPGLSPYAIGEVVGQATVTLDTATTPAHTHTIGVSASNADRSNAQGNRFGVSADPIYSSAAPNATLATGGVTTSGGSQPHNNIMPSLVLRYIIALQGIYPSRP
ncbi:MAG: phage tail protein [Casimicrobium sp.]